METKNLAATNNYAESISFRETTHTTRKPNVLHFREHDIRLPQLKKPVLCDSTKTYIQDFY